MFAMLAITLASTSLAIIMSVVAWRAAREERQRSSARVAALSAEIHGVPMDRVEAVDPVMRAAPSEADLFTSTRRPAGQPRWGVALVAGVLAIAAAAAVAVIFSGESRSASVISPGPASGTASLAVGGRGGTAQADALPLELLALGHERDGDHLTVRGVVLNPVAGTEVSRLIAVVFGFNRDGELVSSGRSSIGPAALAAGARSSFVVTVAGAADVVRYRVSFKSDDRVLPHADRRGKS